MNSAQVSDLYISAIQALQEDLPRAPSLLRVDLYSIISHLVESLFKAHFKF